MEQNELIEILKNHGKWLQNKSLEKRADLRGAKEITEEKKR
mgnify:CR=1 FL=1